jgi:hypothetical protein
MWFFLIDRKVYLYIIILQKHFSIDIALVRSRGGLLVEYNIRTCHLRFIPVGVAKVSQIFLRDAHVFQSYLAMSNTADVTGSANAINPLVAFYDSHGGKREVLFFYFVPDTTR